MTNPTCPTCLSPRQVIKSGLNDSGSQRYRCQACRRYFTPTPKPAGYDRATRNFALKLYLEGTSLRAVGRLLHINHQTVANWVDAEADRLPEQVSDHTPTENVEIDELFTFMGKKKSKSTSC
jgi:transposase-like protein